MAKNLKLPNSYGSVSKLGNASRRRKPYIVRMKKVVNPFKRMRSLVMLKLDKKVYKC